MSIEIFEKAKSLSLKIIELYSLMNILHLRNNNHSQRLLHVDENDRNVLVIGKFLPRLYTTINLDKAYIVLTDRTEFVSGTVLKNLISTLEFDEAYDFQCSTQLDDYELQQYYLFCFLKNNNIEGLVIRRINDEILDDLLSYVKLNLRNSEKVQDTDEEL